jgi:hypothetical protein
MCAIAAFTVSCGDDDEVDCNKLESQLIDLIDEYDDAYDNGDCEDLDELYDKIVDKYKDFKGCKVFKEYLEEEDITFDEYMDEVEEDYQDDVETCGEPV